MSPYKCPYDFKSYLSTFSPKFEKTQLNFFCKEIGWTAPTFLNCEIPVVKDAIASGVDGYDAEVQKSVRKAAHCFRFTREVAVSIASTACGHGGGPSGGGLGRAEKLPSPRRRQRDGDRPGNAPIERETRRASEQVAAAGCDGSILLSDTSSFQGEKTAGPNNNSVRGYNVIDRIKSKVESACPGVVSCADIVAIAARDSVVLLGGPSWEVKLGRRDARTASFSDANRGLPPPSSSLAALISAYKAQGLSTRDMVALSGSHTIGQARCFSFRDHIYNDSNIDSSFKKTRQGKCPRTSGSGDNNLAPLDLQSPTAFDNAYFKNLINNKGLLHSDQQLFNGGSTDSLVKTYSNNPKTFYSDFASAMIKMGDINPLTGSKGEIRKICSKVN